jgi:PAS domain S-box-containing protein
MAMKKKRRRTSDLMSAIDTARNASTDLQIRSLLHELQVHSEEITVQNEQLTKAQQELEQARDRYADLYDFAPIGYLSVDAQGAIVEINLAGSALLGRARRYLIGLPLSGLVAREHRQRLRDFVTRANDAEDGTTAAQTEIQVEYDGAPRTIHLIARPRRPPRGPRELFIAMLDVTEARRLEAERQASYEREQNKSEQLQHEINVRIEAEERVKALLERLVDVQERERRRLALNLHDELGQQLTALRLAIDALKNTKPRTAEAKARFDAMEKIVTQMDRDVDFLAWELRPAALDDVGLEASLQEYLRQWSWTQGVVADFHASLGDARLPGDVESHLYRIVQEALNNVSKHAAAKRVSVILERRGDDVTLIVEDDGRGFDVEAARAARGAGMGLVGMHERAASLGGQLQYESAPGHGTTLFVRIPITVPTPSP